MQEVAQPELRHCLEHLNALLWTCPDDHMVLRSAEEGQAFTARPGRTPDGRYACGYDGAHVWLREGKTWTRAEKVVA